jgi:hypothetical protein
MALVKIEAKEFQLEGMIEEPKQKNLELDSSLFFLPLS